MGEYGSGPPLVKDSIWVLGSRVYLVDLCVNLCILCIFSLWTL